MPLRKIPLYYTFVATIAGGILSFFIFHKNSSAASDKNKSPEAVSGILYPAVQCGFKALRIGGFRFIRPIVYAERECESEKYYPIRDNISLVVDNYKKSGILKSASVYLRVFNQGEWIGYNNEESYNPASLIKVPVLMTYLNEADKKPAILNEKVFFDKPEDYVPKQEFNSASIVPGKNYTIKELLKYMIVYSDNYATDLLNKHLNIPALKKTFTDMGLPEPNVMDKNYQITPQAYSAFFKALYNATYLNRENSEYAISLLAQCDFKDGIVKGLPASVQVAHKFGEGGNQVVHQLHESAIVYLDNTAYLLIIMTKGNDVKELATVISSISKMVYEQLSKQV